MKITRFAAVLATLSAFAALAFPSINPMACGPSGAGCSKHGGQATQTTAPAADAVSYTCPMHPDVTSNKPGKCSKCGMFLEAKAAEKTVYTCSMCPSVKSDKPGKCPECGMNLEKKTEKVQYEYYCSMCPGEVSNKPGSCSKCGMHLEARPKAAAPAKPADPHAGHGH